MNNKKTFFIASFVAGVAIVVLPYLFPVQNEKYPIKNRSEREREDAHGYVNYLRSIRANLITGKVDPADVAAAYQQADALAASNKMSSLNLQWQELGPDNVGGRTRAILFDKTDPNKMFAGSVGGGIWVTTTGGSYWNQVDDNLQNLAVCAITQAANGDVYFGTGEGFYQNSGDGSGGLEGKGIFKSTDGGVTFKQLAATKNFKNVNRMGADPNNMLRIYAATEQGLKLSNDSGKTWITIKSSTGSSLSGFADDVQVASDGMVLARVGPTSLYKSSNGDDGTFVKISKSFSGDKGALAISSSDPNYMYCSVGNNKSPFSSFVPDKIYQSTDKGDTWILIGTETSNSLFKPLGTQGAYANAIAVDPANPQRIFLGGLDVWSWTPSGWTILTDWTQSTINPFYVHADIQVIQFHPTAPNICFIGSDGGLFRTQDAGQTFPSFQTMNKGYKTLQCYSVAASGNGNDFICGAQDNGTQYIDGKGNTALSAKRIGGGDGGYCEISVINPNAFFTGTYYGALRRSSSKGGGNGFYDTHINPLTGLSDDPAGSDPGWAHFVTPFLLWEDLNVQNSVDSVLFTAAPMQQTVANGNGINKNYKDTIVPTQEAAIIVPGSIKFIVDALSVTDDGLGGLTGDGTGTIDYSNGAFNITFSIPPQSGSFVKVEYGVKYNAGAKLKVNSGTGNFPFHYVSNVALNPGDSIEVKDIVQSEFAVGLVGTVWMTKGALNFSNTPKWFKIANIGTFTTSQCMAFSKDGNNLFVGTGNGFAPYEVWRISGLNNLNSSRDTSGTNHDLTIGNFVVDTRIQTFSQSVTGIAVDPNDANNVVVTLGNYGKTDYVYRSTDALSASPTFTSIQGNLPKMPVYKATIDKTNPSRILLATDLGVWATDNGQAASPTWTEENNGMARVATFMVRQQAHDPSWYAPTGLYPVQNSGVYYIGTHGRGMFKCENYLVTSDGNNISDHHKSVLSSGINIYPNPMNGNGVIAFSLTKITDVVMRVYNLQGKLVRSVSMPHQSAGDNKISFDSAELPIGTYLVSLTGEGINATSKFVVVK